jgi:hypothetical protein
LRKRETPLGVELEFIVGADGKWIEIAFDYFAVVCPVAVVVVIFIFVFIFVFIFFVFFVLVFASFGGRKPRSRSPE